MLGDGTGPVPTLEPSHWAAATPPQYQVGGEDRELSGSNLAAAGGGGLPPCAGRTSSAVKVTFLCVSRQTPDQAPCPRQGWGAAPATPQSRVTGCQASQSWGKSTGRGV